MQGARLVSWVLGTGAPQRKQKVDFDNAPLGLVRTLVAADVENHGVLFFDWPVSVAPFKERLHVVQGCVDFCGVVLMLYDVSSILSCPFTS